MILGICEDSDEVYRTQYSAEKGAEFNISSRRFESPVEYCAVETPLGEEMHFSRQATEKLPDKLR